jgi:hypothetical protein
MTAAVITLEHGLPGIRRMQWLLAETLALFRRAASAEPHEP